MKTTSFHKPMHIGWGAHSSELYGAQRYLLESVEAMQELGHTQRVLLPGPGPLLDALRILKNVAIENLPYKWWVQEHQAPSVWKRTARRISNASLTFAAEKFFAPCDVVVTHSIATNIGALAAPDKHLWFLHELPDGWHFDTGREAGLALMKQSRGFIANSALTAEKWKPLLERDMPVVYPGVRDIDKSQPPTNRTFVCVGKLTQEKQFNVAIDALAALPEDVTLNIIGEGPEESSLRAQAKRLGLTSRVQFLGYQSDLRTCIRQARGVVVTCTNESLGRMTIEAMCAGVPTIGPEQGGTVELVRPNETGLLYASGNAASLAEQLQRLLESETLTSTLVMNAHADASKKFSWARFKENLEAAVLPATLR